MALFGVPTLGVCSAGVKGETMSLKSSRAIKSGFVVRVHCPMSVEPVLNFCVRVQARSGGDEIEIAQAYPGLKQALVKRQARTGPPKTIP